MQIKETEVFGFNAAIRGMRNPLNSHHLSDSDIAFNRGNNIENFILGDNDKKLAQKLTKAGSEHCKFLRQIQVWVDLTLPRYIWSEFDTYGYNTKNSESTMHTAHRRNLIQQDFEDPIAPEILTMLNSLIDSRRDDLISSEEFIYGFKTNLPEGFLQLRTVNTNYAELLNIYRQRRNHRLHKQWGQICDWIEQLPYFKELTGVTDER